MVFSLALRLSFETRFVSAGALLSTAGGALLTSLLSTLLPESLVHTSISIGQNQFDVLLLIRRAWAGVL